MTSKVETPVVAENQISTFDPKAIDVASVSQLTSQLAEATPSANIVATYMEFEKPGDLMRVVFLGFQNSNVKDEKTGEVKTLECAAFYDANQNLLNNAGTQIVRTIKEMRIAQGTMLEIEYQGQVKVGTSNYMKNYAIRILS